MIRRNLLNRMNEYTEKYNVFFQFVGHISANAILVKFNEKHLIFLNKAIPPILIPYVIFHEIGHITDNTLSQSPEKYVRIFECRANIYMVFQMWYTVRFLHRIELLFWSLISERILYDRIIKYSVLTMEDINIIRDGLR